MGYCLKFVCVGVVSLQFVEFLSVLFQFMWGIGREECGFMNVKQCYGRIKLEKRKKNYSSITSNIDDGSCLVLIVAEKFSFDYLK